jgi:hypothetical protein
MSYGIDLELAHAEFDRGDLRVTMTWLFEGADRATPQPCMVLSRSVERQDRMKMPVVVTLDNAWRWDPATWIEFDTMERASGFADSLGFAVNKQTVITIAGLINDYLDELLTMPVAPRVKQTKQAEMTVINRNSGEQMEVEVLTR